MKRREFIKIAGTAFLLANAPRMSIASSKAPFTGDFLVQIQAVGAWDVASYCDPKINTANRVVNTWAKTLSPMQAGNIAYAPFANNAEFFPNHYQRMLVINGMHTHATTHGAGRTLAARGKNDKSYPSLSAAYAATLKDQFPIPVIKNGGSFSTGGLVSAASLGSNNVGFNEVLHPGTHPQSGQQYFDDAEMAMISGFQSARAERLLSITSTVERKALLESFMLANQNTSSFSQYTEILDSVDFKDYNTSDSFIMQVAYGLVAIKAGMSVALDMGLGGFDTHGNHDIAHANAMRRLNNGINFLWDLANQLNINNRLFVYVNSDFGRGAGYNGDGKTHHQIGSAIFMKEGVNWTNRTIGETDGLLKPKKINKMSLTVDEQDGSHIEPKHVVQFAREYLGIAEHPLLADYPLDVEGGNFKFV